LAQILVLKLLSTILESEKGLVCFFLLLLTASNSDDVCIIIINLIIIIKMSFIEHKFGMQQIDVGDGLSAAR